ncbi:DUF308 domain-containing protein [Halalkalibacterium halodurans]|uniref:DUF308 domain-containing protein n=1 Tax=Halalkalibacterium halodurans TaxID=86665 RepID=UPI001067E2C1|nr:DUF308 domain-containing protein [Halalkalibacterium halodurans]TES56207.1 DUF308 domain-containing protein [Halalkalibacterium halodurans]
MGVISFLLSVVGLITVLVGIVLFIVNLFRDREKRGKKHRIVLLSGASAFIIGLIGFITYLVNSDDVVQQEENDTEVIALETTEEDEEAEAADEEEPAPNKKESDKESNKDSKKQKSEKKKGTVLEDSKDILYDIFKSGDDPIDETIVSIEFDESDNSLMATVKGKDGWSDESIGRGFYEDSTIAYRQLSSDKRIDEVWISITFPMQDQYGNIEEEAVMETWMSRETMDKINWDNFNYANLLDVVDGQMVYPHFVQ